MPHIQCLDRHVADLIAAGEVVERPASVVKELCENAVDAGAHTVTVEIRNGGMTLIRVTDDGCGIAPEEAPTAFLRHATSKLRNEYDLEAISTLGFRGEALAAISAVARVELLTRRREDAMGTSLAIEGGELLGQEEAGCPYGTTFLVRDLFYNTPARLKFMKKDAAEGAACLAVLHRQALAHPEVSFKFLRDGKQELLTPGDGSLKSTVYAVLGRDLALGLIPVAGECDGVSVSGFASLPTCCRGTRGNQYFFVNGRYIKSQTLTAAVEQAYANQKMVGKFPACVIHLSIKLNAVDVNVHPTKQEVKFSAERDVFSAVHHAVLSALGADKSHPTARVEYPVYEHDSGFQTILPLNSGDWMQKRPDPSTEQTTPPTRAEIPPSAAQVSAEPTVRESMQNEPMRAEPVRSEPLWGWERPAPVVVTEPLKNEMTAEEPQSQTVPTEETETPFAVTEGFAEEMKTLLWSEPPAVPTTEPREEPAETSAPAEEPTLTTEQETPWRVAGELFRTYILVEQGEKALLIDKHAAHERMNFDRMRAVDYVPMSQTLLMPVVFTPTPEEGAILLEHLDQLERIGFEVEDFGGGALMVRSVPDYVEQGETETVLSQIAARLALTGTVGETERMDELYHTMACKAAIKGGWKSAAEELEAVARAVMSGEVKYCPHGRPVAIELSRAELEKQFKRRV